MNTFSYADIMQQFLLQKVEGSIRPTFLIFKKVFFKNCFLPIFSSAWDKTTAEPVVAALTTFKTSSRQRSLPLAKVRPLIYTAADRRRIVVFAYITMLWLLLWSDFVQTKFLLHCQQGPMYPENFSRLASQEVSQFSRFNPRISCFVYLFK